MVRKALEKYRKIYKFEKTSTYFLDPLSNGHYIKPNTVAPSEMAITRLHYTKDIFFR